MNLKNQKGGSLVEFALVAPLLLILLFGIIDMGLLLYNQAVLTNASREGARYGIVAGEPRYTVGEIRTIVQRYEPRLITFQGPRNLDIDVTFPDGGRAFGQDLRVRAEWRHAFLVLPNFPGIGLPNPMQLRAVTVMKHE